MGTTHRINIVRDERDDMNQEKTGELSVSIVDKSNIKIMLT